MSPDIYLKRKEGCEMDEEARLDNLLFKKANGKIYTNNLTFIFLTIVNNKLFIKKTLSVFDLQNSSIFFFTSRNRRH